METDSGVRTARPGQGLRVARDEDQETGVANLRQMLLTYYESVQEGEIPAMCHFAELEGSKR